MTLEQQQQLMEFVQDYKKRSASQPNSSKAMGKGKKKTMQESKFTIADHGLHASQYTGPDGCMQTLITQGKTDGSKTIASCPKHGTNWDPYCAACHNAEHLQLKSQHEFSEQSAIAASLDVVISSSFGMAA